MASDLSKLDLLVIQIDGAGRFPGRAQLRSRQEASRGREAAEGIARVEQKLAAKAGSAKVAVCDATSLISPSAVVSVVPPIGRRVALVIGNGRYRHAAQLPNPPNDAADIAQALRKLGFDVVEGRDLGKREMEDKICEFGRKLERADLALLFYAMSAVTPSVIKST